MTQETPIYDITIKAGANYQIDFDYTDDDEVSVDVSGWTAEAQIRQYAESLYAVAFSCSADENGFHLTKAAQAEYIDYLKHLDLRRVIE